MITLREGQQVRLVAPGTERRISESVGRMPHPGRVPEDAWGQEGTVFFVYSPGLNLGGERALEVRLLDGRDCPVMGGEVTPL